MSPADRLSAFRRLGTIQNGKQCMRDVLVAAVHRLDHACGLAFLQGIGAPLPFLWADLSEQDITFLSTNDMDSTAAHKVLLTAASHLDSTAPLQQAVELDLYKHTLQQAQVSTVAA